MAGGCISSRGWSIISRALLTAIDIHPGAKIGTQFLHRPWLHRDRRDRRDRRRRHHLPERHAGRDQPDARGRRQAPPDLARRRGGRIGRAGTGPDHGRRGRQGRRQCGGHPRRRSGRDDGRHSGQAGAGRIRSTTAPASFPTARRAAKIAIRRAPAVPSWSARSRRCAGKSSAQGAQRRPRPRQKALERRRAVPGRRGTGSSSPRSTAPN